jgi:hypothetical protein
VQVSDLRRRREKKRRKWRRQSLSEVKGALLRQGGAFHMHAPNEVQR